MLVASPVLEPTPSEPSAAIRATNCANARRRSGTALMVEGRLHCCIIALAVYAHARPPCRAMVERSQLLPRFFRTFIFCLRDLAGASPPERPEPSSLVVWPVVPGTRIVCAHRRSDGRRTLPLPFVFADRAGRSSCALFRMELLPGPSVSLGFLAPYDSHSGDCLQPDHIPAAVTGLESGEYDAA